MNNEVEKLIKKADRSMKAARTLLETGDCDFSSSRTYYSMFYAVEALLLTKGLSFSRHAAVISGFYEQFIKTGIFPNEMHKSLHHAFLLRQEGDYISAPNIGKDVASQLLKDADEFIKKVKEYIWVLPQK